MTMMTRRRRFYRLIHDDIEEKKDLKLTIRKLNVYLKSYTHKEHMSHSSISVEYLCDQFKLIFSSVSLVFSLPLLTSYVTALEKVSTVSSQEN